MSRQERMLLNVFFFFFAYLPVNLKILMGHFYALATEILISSLNFISSKELERFRSSTHYASPIQFCPVRVTLPYPVFYLSHPVILIPCSFIFSMCNSLAVMGLCTSKDFEEEPLYLTISSVVQIRIISNLSSDTQRKWISC